MTEINSICIKGTTNVVHPKFSYNDDYDFLSAPLKDMDVFDLTEILVCIKRLCRLDFNPFDITSERGEAWSGILAVAEETVKAVSSVTVPNLVWMEGDVLVINARTQTNNADRLSGWLVEHYDELVNLQHVYLKYGFEVETLREVYYMYKLMSRERRGTLNFIELNLKHTENFAVNWLEALKLKAEYDNTLELFKGIYKSLNSTKFRNDDCRITAAYNQTFESISSTDAMRILYKDSTGMYFMSDIPPEEGVLLSKNKLALFRQFLDKGTTAVEKEQP